VSVCGVVTAGLSVNCSVIDGFGDTTLAKDTVPPTANMSVVQTTWTLLIALFPTGPVAFVSTQC
jgi:hypothetical protein